MAAIAYVAVPDSVPDGASWYIGVRRFWARRARMGERVWVGVDALLGDVVLMRTDDHRYAVVPWLEEAAPRAMRELIRSGLLVPPDPMLMLDAPTEDDGPDDAALRVAVIEGLVETEQLSLDDAWQALRSWRRLRDGATRS